jgi:hypothetical protein
MIDTHCSFKMMILLRTIDDPYLLHDYPWAARQFHHLWSM